MTPLGWFGVGSITESDWNWRHGIISEVWMGPQKVFLTAEWNNLVMLNYAVNPLLLQSLVPSCAELDSFEGRAYVSLVGFEFNRTRVFGWRVPFHSSFEEVNLRFYVRRGERRGVVFIRELVPKFAVAAVARAAFGEHYSRTPMSHRVHAGADGVPEAEYSWGSGGSRCSMRIETKGADSLPKDGSLGQFITEHYWGYAARPDGGCVEYEVRHPRWSTREAKITEFTGNARRYYGTEFAKVLMDAPDSAFFAAGSEVTVFKGNRID